MATVTVYGLGGFDPSKPNGNIVETYEVPDDPPPVPTPDEKLAAAATALAALDGIAAPVLPTDVLDILVDVRTALEA